MRLARAVGAPSEQVDGRLVQRLHHLGIVLVGAIEELELDVVERVRGPLARHHDRIAVGAAAAGRVAVGQEVVVAEVVERRARRRVREPVPRRELVAIRYQRELPAGPDESAVGVLGDLVQHDRGRALIAVGRRDPEPERQHVSLICGEAADAPHGKACAVIGVGQEIGDHLRGIGVAAVGRGGVEPAEDLEIVVGQRRHVVEVVGIGGEIGEARIAQRLRRKLGGEHAPGRLRIAAEKDREVERGRRHHLLVGVDRVDAGDRPFAEADGDAGLIGELGAAAAAPLAAAPGDAALAAAGRRGLMRDRLEVAVPDQVARDARRAVDERDRLAERGGLDLQPGDRGMLLRLARAAIASSTALRTTGSRISRAPQASALLCEKPARIAARLPLRSTRYSWTKRFWRGVSRLVSLIRRGSEKRKGPAVSRRARFFECACLIAHQSGLVKQKMMRRLIICLSCASLRRARALDNAETGTQALVH
jgi:hypothetical protein